MADHAQQQKMVQSALVLQLEATKGLTREFYQQMEAFVALAREHPLTRGSVNVAGGGTAEPVELRSLASLGGGSAGLVSDGVARLSRDTCDAHACVRSAELLGEFLRRLPEAAKTDDDRVQLLFILDVTLQRARKSNTDDGRAVTSKFEQLRGYPTITDWFTQACAYQDEPRRRLAQLALRVLLRNKPKLRFARSMIIDQLQRMQRFVTDKITKELVGQVLDKYRDGGA